MFIDTHTHIYLEQFDSDRDAVIERARKAGVARLLLPAIDETTLPALLATCRHWPDICLPMLGLHPTELPEGDPTPLLERFEQLLAAPGSPFIAVGEVGVDLYWDTTRRDEQLRAFSFQTGWAVRYGLPLVVHSRNAHREIVDTLRPVRHSLSGGIFHCFGGTAEEARELLGFDGFCLGIGGTVTFKKSTLPQVLAQCVPIDRIVLETDAPYLAPSPHRGQRNEPSYIPLVIARLADIYDLTPAEVESVTTATALRLFRL
jgi:TatD DNase family protein